MHFEYAKGAITVTKIRQIMKEILQGRGIIAVIIIALDIVVLFSSFTVFVWLSAISLIGGYEIIRLFDRKLTSAREIEKWMASVPIISTLYISMVFTYFALFKIGGFALCLQVILALRAFDTFALVGGKTVNCLFGTTHKIMPNVSSGKSWEGFFIGLVMGVISIGISSFILTEFNIQPVLELHDWALVALALSLGHLGDFAESYFKRWKVDIKDSGDLLRGHGGILDRFDSFPVVSLTFLVFVLANLV